jgi:hypothetical protein
VNPFRITTPPLYSLFMSWYFSAEYHFLWIPRPWDYDTQRKNHSYGGFPFRKVVISRRNHSRFYSGPPQPWQFECKLWKSAVVIFNWFIYLQPHITNIYNALDLAMKKTT